MIDYDPHDWRSHLFDIKGSMLREIRLRVFVPFLWAALVTGAYEWWQWDIKVADRHSLLPTTIHMLIGTALILTTNLPFSEWTQVIPNARLCKAVLDRITDRAHIIDTGHDSYRLRRTLEKRPKKG